MVAPQELKILFLDDDADILSTAKHDLEGQLKESGLASRVVALGTLDDALKCLETEGFHVAVIDLRLKEEAGGGNEIIRTILESKLLPIIVYSGFPKDLPEELEDHGFIYVVEKKRISYVVRKILDWNEKQVFTFFSEHGFVKTAMYNSIQKTMWSHVSKYWEHLQTDDPASLARTAGRIASTLFYDELVSSPEFSEVSGEVSIHHGEIYIFETPRKHLASGDIIKLADDYLVVLTPACDLVPRKDGESKAKRILLAECISLMDFFENNQITGVIENLTSKKGSKKFNKAVEKVEKLMRHDWLNDAGQFFFLPPFANFRGGVVDFLGIRVEEHNQEERANLVEKRTVSLNREVSAELEARFARFMIRLGQAPYKTAPLRTSILSSWNDEIN